MVRKEAPAPDPDWAYFLDIDGTLLPLAVSPDRVRVDRRLRRLIDDLRRFAGGAVALITGRPIADVDRLFPGRPLPAAGQHGLERRSASGRRTRHAPPARRLDAVRQRLAVAVARHPRLLLEDKGFSLALHYRRAPKLAGYAHRLARTEAAGLGPGYGVRTGKRVVEIGPTGRDKGQAILEFTRERPFRGRVPVFLGDDLTDEIGFEMVDALGGISIKVGKGPSAAWWRFRDVTAVLTWLGRRRPGVRGPR
ncbi:MAG: trehalose-phosphatase [Gemmatimonadetes bacterium]|nr:trehalose-phosphatase [Gemmatimonadota bacterium]